MKLWQILVPTSMEGNPVRTRHHREWDRQVMEIAGGLTLLKPILGKWINVKESTHEREVTDRTIPVQIACTDEQMLRVLAITKKHYRQEAVMAYVVSEQVLIL